MTLTFNLGPDPGQAAQRCTTPSAAVTLPRPGSYSITRPTLTCAPRAGGRRRSCPWALRSRSPPCWQLARWHATLLTTSPSPNPDLLRSYGCLGFVGVSWGSAKLTRTLALSVCAQPFCSPCPNPDHLPLSGAPPTEPRRRSRAVQQRGPGHAYPRTGRSPSRHDPSRGAQGVQTSLVITPDHTALLKQVTVLSPRFHAHVHA